MKQWQITNYNNLEKTLNTVPIRIIRKSSPNLQSKILDHQGGLNLNYKYYKLIE